MQTTASTSFPAAMPDSSASLKASPFASADSSSLIPDSETILRSLDVPTDGLTTEQMNQIVNSLRENAAMLNIMLASDSTAPFEQSLMKSLGISKSAAQTAINSLVGVSE
ncbi:uncharacterized protein MONOS_5011 [Monocercomonoides exilis]|uniref:uncharacterized protein n=1 Tax=Monocercomonoides exilis TaxID=2049356 RepID=UPI00355AC314|nr:hypothetical protein MONOS_5011 [Monocercomonoides exilis]|eukprot:MONOS_5011.1-p1 / transcript=MONOS_5011.1 / gene=MONOS_5011 / organism=Monocercomonoides_exilis_PA203 / gene_product=unspecified product / transcript_product=unspecified product / location=Mono_scaffold00141:45936-46325(+) / protein_length=110 / sequence_SO=supercontig / SO=protein_coding / is_pseudo=false